MSWIDLALAMLMIVPVAAGLREDFARTFVGLAAMIRGRP
jgi:hypothetical protein